MKEFPKPPEEGAGGGPGEWVVSFNDCMTNMLCFFVLLVSFSSFDEADRSRVSGAFQSISAASVFPSRTEFHDIIIEPWDPAVEITEQGSQKPDPQYENPIRNPKQENPPPQLDAYKDKHRLYLLSDRLFYAEGTAIRPESRPLLDMVVGFLAKMPCQVVIREVRPADNAALDRRLARAHAVLEHLQAGGVEYPRLSIASSGPEVPQAYRDAAVIEITLINRSVVK